jgi:ComF family protein
MWLNCYGRLKNKRVWVVMSSVSQFLKSLFSPRNRITCVLCGDDVSRARQHLAILPAHATPEKAKLNLSPIFCPPCQQSLPFVNSNGCPQCAIEDTGGQLCGVCIAHPPKFDATIAAFRYQFPLDRLVQDYKFNANFALLELFATALADRIIEGGNLPDVFIPVPLSRQRIATRGFNQAALLADAVVKKLNVKLNAKQTAQQVVRVENNWLEKIRDTPAQAGLALEARRRNIRDAFTLTPLGVVAIAAQPNLKMALFDDVITTGATLSEAANVLKRAGVVTVTTIVVARVPPPRAKLQRQSSSHGLVG